MPVCESLRSDEFSTGIIQPKDLGIRKTVFAGQLAIQIWKEYGGIPDGLSIHNSIGAVFIEDASYGGIKPCFSCLSCWSSRL